MAFFDHVLLPHCKLYRDSLPGPNKAEAIEIDSLRQERDKSYRTHVNVLHHFWKKREDGSGLDQESNGENVVDTITVKDNYSKLKEASKLFEEKLNDVLKRKSDPNQGPQLEPPCALYGAFIDVGNLKYQESPNRLTIGGDHSDRKTRLCKYLDEKYPDSNRYAYQFPVSYDFRTGGSDKRKICSKLSCSRCLSHYSDKILNELARERGDDPVQKQEITKNVTEYLQRRNSLKAVQNVCQRIELWSRRKNAIHMFIMANVDYKTYLKQYNHNKPVTANEGDHDILLIIKEVGVVFIQVKSCTIVSNDCAQIKQAFKQVIRDQFVFLESNRDLDFISPAFPVWGFVALPNVNLYSLSKECLCDAHWMLVLCKEDLEPMTWFDEILKQRKSANVWTEEQFRYLCARYVGEGKTKGMQDLPRAIEGVIKMFGTKIFTPKQDTILENESPFQVIKGEFGSGKSLLLCKKVYDLSVQKAHDPAHKTDDFSQKTGYSTEKKDDPSLMSDTSPEQKDDPTQKTNNQNQNTSDLTKTTNDLIQKTDDSSQRTDDPSNKTDNPSQKTDDPIKHTDYPFKMTDDPTRREDDPRQNTQKTDNATKKTDDPSQKTDDVIETTGDPSQKKDDPTQNTEDLTRKTNDPSQKTDDSFKMTDDPTQRAEDLTPKAADPTQKTDNSTRKTDGVFQVMNHAIKKTDNPSKNTDIPTVPTRNTNDPAEEKIFLITCVGLDQNFLLNTQLCHFPAVQQLDKYIADFRKQQEKNSPVKSVSENQNGQSVLKIEILTLGSVFKRYKLPEEPLQNNVKITSEKFNSLFMKLMKESKKIFIDEMPLDLFKDLESHMFSIREQYKGFEGYHVWVAISTQSCFGALDPKNEISSAGMIFQSDFLEENMRNSCAISRFLKFVSSYTGETLINDPDIGHRIEGPIPLLFRIPCCHCPIDVARETFFCECLERRIQSTLNFVHSVLGLTNENNADVVYMVSHIYTYSFKSSIFCKLRKVFDKVFKGLDKRYSWITLADPETTGSDAETSNSNKETTDVATKTIKSDGKMTKSDTEATKSETKTTDSETHTAKSDTKMIKSDGKTTDSDTVTTKSDKGTRKTELIIDEATFVGCESSIVIYIDLLSMWDLLPEQINDENDQQCNTRPKVGLSSILVPSRCTSQYVHIVLQGEEPRIFINEHIRMFTDKKDSGKDKNMNAEYEKAIETLKECLENQGDLLEKLLDDGVMREINFPSTLGDGKHGY